MVAIIINNNQKYFFYRREGWNVVIIAFENMKTHI